MVENFNHIVLNEKFQLDIPLANGYAINRNELIVSAEQYELNSANIQYVGQDAVMTYIASHWPCFSGYQGSFWVWAQPMREGVT